MQHEYEAYEQNSQLEITKSTVESISTFAIGHRKYTYPYRDLLLCFVDNKDVG